MLIYTNFNDLKTALPDNAFTGYKRRNASNGFEYWDLNQCIDLLKTISDNLKVNI
jgi:hypothetical protein